MVRSAVCLYPVSRQWWMMIDLSRDRERLVADGRFIYIAIGSELDESVLGREEEGKE